MNKIHNSRSLCIGIYFTDACHNFFMMMVVCVPYTKENVNFLTISYLFSTPINCSDLEFHRSFEVLHLEKFLFGKIFFPFGTIIFPIFPHKKTGKVKRNGILFPKLFWPTVRKNILLPKIVRTFHCLNKLFYRVSHLEV